jgi:hypothetical protein
MADDDVRALAPWQVAALDEAAVAARSIGLTRAPELPTRPLPPAEEERVRRQAYCWWVPAFVPSLLVMLDHARARIAELAACKGCDYCGAKIPCDIVSARDEALRQRDEARTAGDEALRLAQECCDIGKNQAAEYDRFWAALNVCDEAVSVDDAVAEAQRLVARADTATAEARALRSALVEIRALNGAYLERAYADARRISTTVLNAEPSAYGAAMERLVRAAREYVRVRENWVASEMAPNEAEHAAETELRDALAALSGTST